jgi:hypothetical protein
MEKVGKWLDYIRQNPPSGLAAPKTQKQSVRALVRHNMKIKEGDSCFVCATDVLEELHLHHLLPVSSFSDRPDINEHLLCLCQNCHDITHNLIYGDRKGVSFQTMLKLKEDGRWDKLVEIDRMAVAAAKGVAREVYMEKYARETESYYLGAGI